MLYNRLGATHANSGRAEQAMQYYFRALELQPTYARARYNLAVASISLGNHQEAAEYLLTALAQQESEYQGSDRDVGAMQDDRAGVSSESSSSKWVFVLMHSTRCSVGDSGQLLLDTRTPFARRRVQ